MGAREAASDHTAIEERPRQEAVTVARVKRASNGTSNGDKTPSTIDAWQRTTQFSTIGLFVFATFGCLYLSHSVVVPVLLALVVGTILLPVVELL